MTRHVFISYARVDQDYVEQLARYIADSGFEVWYDSSIETGSSFGDRIRVALDQSAVLVVVLTPASVRSKWVLREISYADQRNIPLVPLLLADCEKPIEVAALQHHDVRGGRMVGHDFMTTLGGYAQRSAAPGTRVHRHQTVTRRRSRGWLVAGAVALALLLGGGGTAAYLASRAATDPAVTVSKGTPCGEGTGATDGCRGGFCSFDACAYVHVTTAGFPGQVACKFASDDPDVNASWERTGQNAWGPNESKDSLYWLGIVGIVVRVTCGGVEGSFTWS